MLRRWGALVAVSAATLVLLVDFMAVSVALPAIQRTTGASYSELQWVLEAFVLTVAAFLLTAGYIADLIGRRPVFLGGLAVFTIGSLLAYFSHTPFDLIGSRVVQGVGGALMFATGPVLLTETFRLRSGRAALAVWGTVTGLAVASSPFVGGVITWSLGWHWIFGVSAAAAGFAFLVGAISIAEPSVTLAGSAIAPAAGPAKSPAPMSAAGTQGRSPRPPDSDKPLSPDWQGLGLFTAAIAILVIGLVRTNTASTGQGGWSQNGVWACFACTGLLLVAFVAVQAVTRAPMLEISLFRQRTFAGSSIAAFGLSMAVFGPFMFLVLYLSYDLGFSALGVGERLLLLTGMTVPFLPLSGFLDRYVPVKFLICPGLAMVGAGFWLLSRVSAGSTWKALVPGLIVAGAGVELVSPRLASAAAATVKPHLAAVASRTSSTFRQLGTAIGVAVFGSVFSTRLADDINRSTSGARGLAGQGTRVTNLVLQGHVRGIARLAGDERIPAIVHRSYADAMHEVFLVAAVVALASAVLALSVRSRDVPRPGRARPAVIAAASPAAGTSGARAKPTGAGPTGAGAPVAGASGAGRPASRAAAPVPSPTAPQALTPPEPSFPPRPEGALRPAVTDLTPGGLTAAGERRQGPPAADATSETPGPEALGEPAAEALGEPAAEALGEPAPEALGEPAPEALVGPEAGDAALIDLTGERHSVRGQVKAASGEPLPGATVTLVGADGDEAGRAIADEEGSFALGDVADGTYTLVALAPNFRTAASMVALRAAEATTTVSLLGIGSLAGTVTRAKDGSPLAAQLDLLGLSGSLALSGRSDRDGSFVLADVLEGEYQLVVTSPGFRPESVPVALKRGQTSVLEVALVGLGHIYGAVSTPAGGWLPEVPVQVRDNVTGTLAITSTDGAGSYHFDNVPEGSYTLSAVAPKGPAGEIAAIAAVTVDAGTTVAVDLTLRAV